MGDLVKKAKSLHKSKFWSEMFLVGPETIDLLFEYGKKQHEQEMAGQTGGGLGPSSRFTAAGSSTRNTLARHRDPFMPAHDMPELDAKMRTWEVIGGRSVTVNKYKQLLWLKSIKDAYIKHNIPLPNGLELRMVVNKIKQIRDKYAQKFRELNFAAYNLHDFVRRAPSVPPPPPDTKWEWDPTPLPPILRIP